MVWIAVVPRRVGVRDEDSPDRRGIVDESVEERVSHRPSLPGAGSPPPPIVRAGRPHRKGEGIKG
jgi:hypothetical protein